MAATCEQEKHRLALLLASADDKDHGAMVAALRRTNPALVVFTTVPIAGSTTRYHACASEPASSRRTQPSVTNIKGVMSSIDMHRVLFCRSAPPGMLVGQWQKAGMAEARPVRVREMVQVGMSTTVQTRLCAQPELLSCQLPNVFHPCAAGVFGSCG